MFGLESARNGEAAAADTASFTIPIPKFTAEVASVFRRGFEKAVTVTSEIGGISIEKALA